VSGFGPQHRAESFGPGRGQLAIRAFAASAADRLTNQIIKQAPQLIGARPFVVGIVQGLLNTAPFRALVRRAALYAHAAAFSENGRNVVLSIPDIDIVLRGALSQASPELAAQIPPRLGTTLANLGSDRRPKPSSSSGASGAHNVGRRASSCSSWRHCSC
jgi:hypothetical protein